MNKLKTLDRSIGSSVARRVSDAQPGALGEAMEVLERDRKMLSPLTDAMRLAELGTTTSLGEDISSLSRLGDPLSDLTPSLGIERSAIESARGAFTSETDDLMHLTSSPFGELSGAVRIENDLAETGRKLSDPLGVNSSMLNGTLGLGKAAGAFGEIDSLRDAISVATGSLGVLEEHERMFDLLGVAQPYHQTAIEIAAGSVASAIPAPRARNEIAYPQKGSVAREKITSAKNIGELVRAARRKMKLNQQEFADLAGVGRRFVSELESGKPTLEFNKVLKACAAAGIDVTASGRSLL